MWKVAVFARVWLQLISLMRLVKDASCFFAPVWEYERSASSDRPSEKEEKCRRRFADHLIDPWYHKVEFQGTNLFQDSVLVMSRPERRSRN